MLKESKEDIVEPLEIREDELLTVHTQDYLNSLKVSPTPLFCMYCMHVCIYESKVTCMHAHKHT